MRKSLPIFAAVLTACGATATTADNAADSSQGPGRGKQAKEVESKAIRDSRAVASWEEGGMPGCFDPSLQGRERAVAERLGGTPCEGDGGASPPPATNARSETWIVGAWAESRAACQGDTGLIFDRNGTYTAAGSENGRWTLSGNSLSFTALETFEMGEEGVTPVRNPQPFHHRIVAHSANAYSSRAPDGSVMTMVRCP